MPLYSVEALLDPACDAEVRREWAALADAGLPSRALHRGASNAPHVTLWAAARIDGATDAGVRTALDDAGVRLPMALRLGPLVVLGSRRLVLARLVVPGAALLALHTAVAGALTAREDGAPVTVRPGRWVPHVTLASGLAAEQVGRAVGLLDGPAQHDGEVVALRRWDPHAGTTHAVVG